MYSLSLALYKYFPLFKFFFPILADAYVYITAFRFAKKVRSIDIRYYPFCYAYVLIYTMREALVVRSRRMIIFYVDLGLVSPQENHCAFARGAFDLWNV